MSNKHVCNFQTRGTFEQWIDDEFVCECGTKWYLVMRPTGAEWVSVPANISQRTLNESARRRCHHDNVEITEYGTSITQHVRNGITGEWDHNSDFGDYTGSIAVYCPECGYTGRFAQSRPKWVQRALGEATCTDWKQGWPDSSRKGRDHE